MRCACELRGLSQREPLVLHWQLWHLSLGTRLGFPLHFCPLRTSCFHPGCEASPKALSLGQAALRHTAGMFLHCRAPPSSQALGYGKKRPCLMLTGAVGRTALPRPAGKDGRSVAVSHQGHPSSPQPHGSAAPAGPWSGPWGQLQTAGGGTRASMAWLPALPFPTTKGCSRIYCYSQRWQLPTVLGRLPPPSLPHRKLSLAQRMTLKMQHCEETLELALNSHSQARLKSTQTKCAYN